MSEVPKIGLALSGGGFRATLFHLGVVRYLHEAGLLRNVTHICSVSGGSILAGHLALNWEQYLKDFDRAAGELIAFIRSDVRGRVLRRWAFSAAAFGLPRLLAPGRWSRTALLQAEYDALYRGATLFDVERAGGPKLHVVASSMTNGQLVSFGEGRITVCNPPIRPSDPERAVPEVSVAKANPVPLALAVAASSAFPPLFPPVKVTHEILGLSRGEFPNGHHLADGGVFDNLGIRKLLLLSQPSAAPPYDIALVSDAQRVLSLEMESEYTLLTSRATRASDMMMDRVRVFESAALTDWANRIGKRAIFCRLQDGLDDKDPLYRPREENAIQNVRTDLDAFDPHEINALVAQGFGVARQAWQRDGRADPSPLPGSDPYQQTGWRRWQPPGCDDPAPVTPRSAKRRIRIFRYNDWASVATLAVLLLFATGAGALFGLPYWRTHQLNEQLTATQGKLTDADDKAQKATDKAEKTQTALTAAEGKIAGVRRAYEWEIEKAARVFSHTSKKIQLIRAAYALGAATSAEKALAAKNAWADLWKDPERYYERVGFKTHEGVQKPIAEIDKILDTWPNGGGPFPDDRLRVQAEKLAQGLRAWHLEWIRDNFERRTIADLQIIRNDAYREVRELAQRILEAPNPAAVAAERTRFREVTTGVLALLTEDDVEYATGRFEWELLRWEPQTEGPSPGLKEAGAKLMGVISPKLSESPQS
ncbi:MAG: patatin-like phospholipase family protein [Planctomycetes bacterium]|nr:patatin-like phospholipase family protein [Planctomycetota bacterium]